MSAVDESSFHTLFDEKTILLGMRAASRNDVLAELIDGAVAGAKIPSARRDAVLEAMLARESLGSTGIGGGIAIPHAKTDDVKSVVTAVGVSRAPIDFKAVDGEPCDVFFLLLSPKAGAETHLKMLRWLSKLKRNADFCRFLRSARTPREVLSLLQEMGE